VSIAPVFPLLAAEFHLNVTQLSLLVGVTVIANGYFNFLIIPFSNILGRRAALIIFGVIICASHIWGALATSHARLLGARGLIGVAAGTTETIMVQIIADMFFLHERGLWRGVYL
jgi:MFS family permease